MTGGERGPGAWRAGHRDADGAGEGRPEAVPANPVGTGAGAVVPPHESAVRRLAADATGRPYHALRTLAEARAVDDGVVVLEGDLGGQVYAVFPASAVRCSEEQLRRLARDLDRRLRPSSDGSGTDVYFERHRFGERIAGGAGGGVVLPGGWAHDELVQAGLEAAIAEVITGRRDALGPS
jgi:hypothetical protein